MFKRIILVLIVITPIIFIILSFLGLFKFIGFEYDNAWSLLLFLFTLVIIELAIDNVLVLFNLKNSFFIINLSVNLLALYITDSIITSVHLSLVALLLCGIILSILDFVIQDDV